MRVGVYLAVAIGLTACNGPLPASVHRVASTWRGDGAAVVRLELTNTGAHSLIFASAADKPHFSIDTWAYGAWAREPQPEAAPTPTTLAAGEVVFFEAEIADPTPAARVGVSVSDAEGTVRRIIWSEPLGHIARRADAAVARLDKAPVAAAADRLVAGSLNPPDNGPGESGPLADSGAAPATGTQSGAGAPGEPAAVEPTEPPLGTAVLGEPPPRRPDALRLFTTAQNALGRRKHKRATKLLGQCLRREPDASECQRLLGDTYVAWGRPRQAERAYRRYLELWPDLPNAAPTRRSLAELERTRPAR